MVIDFSQVSLKERPVLVLRNADGTAIQTLGYAFNIRGDFCFNEMSVLEFDLPAFVEGKCTPNYDKVIGTRTVDLVGWGQFELVNPAVTNTGVREIKNCKAYSLEYELTKKKLTLTEGTYNFWNPVVPEETIIGIILSYFPSWSIGEIDPALIGKYRTFSVSNANIYNFIKSTIQQTYGCIFDFDTYNRRISVRATTSVVSTMPAFISPDNLAKEIKIEEKTEELVTVLDVNGAEGVSIRSVNPTGANKIYNLDYFMTTDHFSQEMIDKWNDWKTTLDNYQLTYYNTVIERMLKTSQILVEEETLRELKEVGLATLENERSIVIEYLASLVDTSSEEYTTFSARLTDVNTRIAAKQSEIAAQEAYIVSLNEEKDILTSELSSINTATDMMSFFTEEEYILLDRYFKEDSIEDASFVMTTAETYTGADISTSIEGVSFLFGEGIVTKILGTEDKALYTIEGGKIILATEASFSANVIHASFELNSDDSFVLSAYLGSGTYGTNTFAGGCISLAGTGGKLEDDTIPDIDAPNSYQTGTTLSADITSARFYFTKNTTEYEQFSVEWELYQYGQDCLNKLAHPSFSFSVSSANFLALDDFVSFASKIALGQKLYLDTKNTKILEPILIKVSVEFNNLTSLELEFGDTYNLSDSSFSLVDLLEKSVSMGKTLDTNRFSYNSFIDSGASTAVKDFMDSALNTSKNAIISGDNMAVSWDSNGLWLRKWNADKTGYMPEQIAAINNSIVFTDDGWNTVKMAIGHIVDPNIIGGDNTTGDAWGVVAPNIVGTLLAGQNLVIESVKKDGDISVFRVDADGAVLHNARFDIENGVSHIVLDPVLGFGIGAYPVIDAENDEWDEDNAKFWVDTDGNVHFKGTLEGADGYFSGTVQAADFLDANGNSMMTDDGRFDSNYLDLGNIILNGSNGDIELTGSIVLGGTISFSGASDIVWGDNAPVQYQFSATGAAGTWHDTMQSGDKYRRDSLDGGKTWGAAYQFVGEDGRDGGDFSGYYWITQTTITGTSVSAPTINANEVRVSNCFTVGNASGSSFESVGYMGIARGKTLDYDPDTGVETSRETYGVALTAMDPDNMITYDTQGNYIIVTDEGVRLQSINHSLVLTANGAFYDGVQIGTGGAVFA